MRGMIEDAIRAIKDDPGGAFFNFCYGVFVVVVIGAVVFLLVSAIRAPKQVYYDNAYCHTTSTFTGFLNVGKTLIPQYTTETTCITPVPAVLPTAPVADKPKPTALPSAQ